MITADLNTIALTEFTAKSKPGQKCKAAFPLLAVHGTSASAAVYIELAPGNELGRHTDSAEETLLVLEGEVEATVGDESGRLAKGQLAVVPRMVPHNLKNLGQDTARVLGFFGGANNIVATFDEVWLPTNTNTVDTSQMQ
ncbi:cupin domain-containing protein [Botryobacter ruber]|uniref:cupin domain-containing protein n=1 Tax=Botryobacter ruber TaxID=2171629 RepID=UPI000E0BDF0D|nr:cupin domain-containing protein [Botryobacter ruber]